MNKTLKEKINRTKQLFIISTNNMNNWRQQYDHEYRSTDFNGYRFTLRSDKGQIFLSNYNDMLISNYRLEAFLFNFKTWIAVRKIVNHFNQIKKDKKVQAEIDFFNKGIQQIEPNFVKEIRKEKLKELEK